MEGRFLQVDQISKHTFDSLEVIADFEEAALFVL